MADKDTELAVWLGHYTDRINANEQLSKDYAHLALQSLVGMNAGALLAIPPIVEVFFSTSLGFAEAVWPMSIFLLGLVAAIGAAYAAYFNFQYHNQSLWAELRKQTIEIDEKFDTSTVHRLKDWRGKTRVEYEEAERRADKFANVHFFVSNGLGVLSLLSFLGGVFWFAAVSLTNG